MALGKTRITNRGYKTVYTVPAGKRAVVNAIANAASSGEIIASATVPAVGFANANFDNIGITATGAVNIGELDATFTGDASNNQLGYAVAIDGNYAVVGYGIGGVVGKIQIYFYNGTAWTLQQTITDPANGTSATFGSAVAISGDHIIVGDHLNDQNNTNSGRAYRYTRSGTTWSLTATYVNPTSGSSEFFGRSVAIAGDFIVIGSDGFNAGSGVGRAYGYRVSTGTTVQVTFENPVGNNSDLYGFSVACWSDGRVVIGSYGFSANTQVGRAYYYAAFSNTVTATINNPNNAGGDRFGYTVACDKTGNFFAVGSERFSNGNAIGRVYTYSTVGLTGTVNTALATITSPTGVGNSNFGTGLAMDSAGNLLIGSYLYDGAGADQGRAYYYTRSNNAWTLAQTFENPTPAGSDNYGFGVAIGSASIATVFSYRGINVLSVPQLSQIYVIGAYQDDSNGFSNNGAVYFYKNASPFSAAQITQIQGIIDNLLDGTTDRVSLGAEQTFERTGLVLDAGESLIVSLPDANGDVSVQVRGYEETL